MKWIIAALAVTVMACSSNNDNNANNGSNGMLPDIEVPDQGPLPIPDAARPDEGTDTVDMTTPNGPIVELDLEPYLGEAGDSNANVYELQGDAPFTGPVIEGRPGDWVLENEVARFLVQADKRFMSPCPWGGTVVDAASLAGGGSEDILGEICLLVNGGQTFRPDQFDVLADGSDGRAVVLAASGTFTTNDFLNLPVMVDDFVEGLGDAVKIDLNREIPVRITNYYILRPGETALHVVTAFRNDTDAAEHLVPIYLVASGGDGEYYNPEAATGGFGSGGTTGIGLDNFPFIAFHGDSATYAFVPQSDPDLNAPVMPRAGSYLIISGVAAAALGASSSRLLPLLTSTPEKIAEAEEVVHVEPGETEILEHRLFVGGGSIAEVTDPIYDWMNIDRGTVIGTVRDPDGNPVEGARVSAVSDRNKALNQALSAADGTFSMKVPAGTYEISARKGGMPPFGAVAATVAAGEEVDVADVDVDLPGRIVVRVTTPDDGCETTTNPAPIPARLTVLCAETPCPSAPQKTEFDTGKNSLPDDIAAVVYSGTDGVLEVDVPPGAYRLVVSRGMEWSVWPQDLMANGGTPLTAVAGETHEFDVEIARVVDTPNAYSGDFHVHTIRSPDSPVPWNDRVRNFMAEGVDVIVSTDHDSISDYRPVVTALGGDAWIRNVVGEEITTADLGHFNAFPLAVDPSHGRGGAIDWGGGDSYTLLPGELFAAAREIATSDPVVQMNHADGLGFVRFAEADVLRGISYASREKHRLPPEPADPMTGDTKIWSDDFTAMELFNGSSRTRWAILGRWWMTMIGRGFTPTGTAVTDTHKLYADIGGAPRSYVFGQNDYSCGDQPFATLTDEATFIEAYAADVNAGRVLGTNGPFFTVSVTNGAGDNATMGDTIAADSETVATLDIQTPEWMRVVAVDVYMNPDPEDVITAPGEAIEDPIPPTETINLTWDETTQLTTVTTGAEEHRAWRQSVQVPLSTTEDAFVIFVVRGGQSMAPIHASGPFAFSNPVYLDADGGGYDNPPYATLAELPPDPNVSPCRDAFCGNGPPVDGELTPAQLMEIIRHYDCKDPSHGH